MIIGVCGYGYTGSGALLDLLREYDGFSQLEIDMEFILTYYPDGLESLANNAFEHPSRFMNADVALYRFKKFIYQYSKSSTNLKKATNGMIPKLSDDFIKEITDCTWNGHWMFDFLQKQETAWGRFFSRAFRYLQHKFDKYDINIYLIKRRKMTLVTDREKFYKAAKKFVRALINEMLPNHKERVVLNQPFAANYPSKSFRFFDDPRAIIVDRDPRDVYILAKKALKSSSAWIPTDNVYSFIKYYKWMHNRFEDEKSHSKVLIINFEDLVYDTDSVIMRLEKFVGKLGSLTGKRFFFPEVSINNTQLFHRFKQYSDDIKIIERELSDYLYDFSGKSIPNFKTDIF